MNIRIGTSEVDGTFHRQGEAIASFLRKKYNVETKPMTGSSVGSALGLDSGELEFGFSASNWVGRALRGENPFDKSISLRMVAPANVGPMFFVVREDSKLYHINDMRGCRVAVNFSDSGMFQHTKTIFGILGISFDDFDPVYVGFEEGAEKLIKGEIDAQWQCPIPNPVMTKLANKLNVRVLEYGAGQLEEVIEKAKFYRQATMHKGSFSGVLSDTKQVGVLNVIATHERVNSEQVKDFVVSMITNARELGKIEELFTGLNDLFSEIRKEGRSIIEPDCVRLHDGAVEAYRELGLL
jgi:TRAP transporter TAXI family solute receptor